MNATISQLTDHVLSLPVGDRVALAQKLWESIELSELVEGQGVADAVAMARTRSAEIEAGEVQSVSHEEVMRAARENLG